MQAKIVRENDVTPFPKVDTNTWIDSFAFHIVPTFIDFWMTCQLQMTEVRSWISSERRRRKRVSSPQNQERKRFSLGSFSAHSRFTLHPYSVHCRRSHWNSVSKTRLRLSPDVTRRFSWNRWVHHFPACIHPSIESLKNPRPHSNGWMERAGHATYLSIFSSLETSAAIKAKIYLMSLNNSCLPTPFFREPLESIWTHSHAGAPRLAARKKTDDLATAWSSAIYSLRRWKRVQVKRGIERTACKSEVAQLPLFIGHMSDSLSLSNSIKSNFKLIIKRICVRSNKRQYIGLCLSSDEERITHPSKIDEDKAPMRP